jgi:hypothetical protein
MELPNETVCTELLLDLIYYEILCGRLSSEMEYLFERHLENCPSCRRKILGFNHILHSAETERNFG